MYSGSVECSLKFLDGRQPNRRRLGVYVNRFATYDCLPLDQSSSDLRELDWYKTDQFLEQLFFCLLT